MCLDIDMSNQQTPNDQPKSNLRKQLEVISTPALLKINSWPRSVVPIFMVGALLVGLFVPGAVGGFFILVVGLFVGWLLFLSWPLLPVRARALRLAVVILIIFSAISQITLT